MTTRSQRIAITLLSVYLVPLWSCSKTSDKAPAPAPQRRATSEAADWCTEHALPESKCTKCNPALVARFKKANDWCAGHGFPESVCPFCNPVEPPRPSSPQPRATGEAADWCAEHALPESKCTKCNPTLVARFKKANDWCAGHGFPESVCPVCNPAKPPADSTREPFAPGTRIRFRSPKIEREAGIGFVPARAAAFAAQVTCPARIDFDQNRVADVRAAVPGVVREVLVDLGARVKKGARLFVLESGKVGDLQGQLGAAEQRLAAARADLDRQQKLRTSGIASSRQVELARQELAASRAALGSLSQSLRIAGAPSAGRTGRYTLRAPLAGAVVRRPATVGTFGGPQTSLATIADTSVMWAVLDVREGDASSVRLAQKVVVRVAGTGERTFLGQVTWIAPEVDRRTRSVAVRAQLDNKAGALRANQFGTGTIEVAIPKAGVAVPTDAVQRLAGASVVFIRRSAGIYEPRQVQLGRQSENMTLIEGGVRIGDLVVNRGAFLLKTELSKENIGAGCCEVDQGRKR